MKMLNIGKVALAFVTVGLFAVTASAQWPSDAASNLTICDRQGEQTLPKVAVTSDGGCYVSWYDHASGNYDVYLQRLDSLGTILWETNGLLISNHQQDTWITDYSMTVDQNDNCILAINDIRAGGDWDIYGYSISPDGTFNWGDNGLTLSDNPDFEPFPVVTVTTDNNIVFAWQRATDTTSLIDIRMVDANGADVWDPSTITLSSQYGLSIPRIAATDDGGFILSYLDAQGAMFYSPKYIYTQKFDADGAAQWGDGLLVSNAGNIGPQVFPGLLPDGQGGAFSFWYDTRVTNEHHTFVQHINSDGTVAWTENGVRASNTTGQMEMTPTLAVLPDTAGVMVFYKTSNLGQTETGVGGQRLDWSGSPRWSDNGVTFVQLDGTTDQMLIQAQTVENDAVVTYEETTPNSAVNTVNKAFRVNQFGQRIWPGQTITYCTVNSGKLHPFNAVNRFNQVISVWGDDRNDQGDIYLQDINPDGSLGMLPPPPAPEITITAPVDMDSSDVLPISVYYTVDNFNVAEEGGDGVVEVNVNGTPDAYSTSADSVQISSLNEGENTIVLQLVDYDHNPLDPVAADTVHIVYWINSVDEQNGALPKSFALKPAYPNPFNPTTQLQFAMPHSGHVSLVVYDINGRMVKTLVNGTYAAGEHRLTWNASNLASGVYFVRMNAGSFSATQKVVRLK